ncbi:MAG: hypothetical protein ACFBRM_06480 [Pikeienuella sp.]
MPDAYDFWAARLPREDLLAIDDFWRRFEPLAPRIARFFRGLLPGLDVDRELRNALGPLAERVVGDFEFAPDGAIVLVLTPELYHSRRMLARALVDRAPDLVGWRMRDARWPVAGVTEAVKAILDRSRADAIAVEEITVRRGAHRLVELTAVGQGDPQFIADQAGVIFSVLLGERADQDWLGTCNGRARRERPFRVSIALRQRPQRRADQWLGPFRAAALSAIESFEADRPQTAFGEKPMLVEDCATFRLRPIGSDPLRRHDAMTYQTRYRALTAARLAGVKITGLRFSRFGEIFCGLKIRRAPPHPFDEVADIASLGTKLEDVLMVTGIGGLIGRASGVEHVYLDLALVDLERAVEVLRSALQREGLVGPAWLIFDDAGLEDHYLPLTAKTPESPALAV